MAGRSLHIGLNQVDPNAYGGWDGRLAGCINDANAMKAIADGLGYQSMLLLDSEATSHRVISEIGRAARSLSGSDIFLLTYSGHGGQVNDVNGDEVDGQDETWVLWDRMVVDDELYSLWCQFAAGVRIFMLSDSCHSGTVARMMMYRNMPRLERDGPAAAPATPPVFRLLPPDVKSRVNELHRDMYETVQWCAGPAERAAIGASVLLISGCQDNQLSSDGAVNGLFTEKLLQVWNRGGFSGDYRRFWRDIGGMMPPQQSPNLYAVGATNAAFEGQKPFTIASPSGAPSPVPSGRPTLRRGMSGPDVRYMQERLVAHGYFVTTDGVFGPGTETQVKAFQSSRGLGADGVVGPMTWQALETTAAAPSTPSPTPAPTPTPGASRPRLQRGMTGPDVTYLQQLLVEDGYRVSVDGNFGPMTESAVKMFQSSNGLDCDGVVGQRTWQVLEQRTTRAAPGYQYAEA